MKIDYIIFAPDFIANSAGIRALYILADRLNRKGYKTYVSSSNTTDPDLRAPLMSMPLAKRFAKMQTYTAVYPETVPGNPLGARKVARWVLNRPGLLDGEEIYDPNEVVFNYANAYSSYIINKVHGKLYLPTIDQTLFYPPKEERPRTLECFYVGKSAYKDGFFEREKTFEITRTSPARAELGKILRSAKVLYCFDNSTILAYEAALCGCPTVIIPDGTQTRADYEKQELGMNGIAWGPEEFARAQATVREVAPYYERAKQEFERQLDNFIALTAPVLHSVAHAADLGAEKGKKRPSYEDFEALRPANTDTESAEIKELTATIDLLLVEILRLHNSKYFVLRNQLEAKYPRLVDVSSNIFLWIYHRVRTSKHLFLKRKMARQIKRDVETRRKALS